LIMGWGGGRTEILKESLSKPFGSRELRKIFGPE
jgi:hypothetical protein